MEILNTIIMRLLNIIYGMRRKGISYSHLLTLLMIMLPLSCGASGGDENFPSYFVDQIKKKISEIRKMSRQGASFIFITDTHVMANEMHSPRLIKNILDSTYIQTVIWGGDAINPKDQDIDNSWRMQLRFDSVFNNSYQIYKVRGNHEFSIVKNKKYPNGLSYSNEKVSEYLLMNCPSNIHRNTNDSGACYYFFDDTPNKVRFIVFDTTDSVPSRDYGWGNIPFIHDTQLQWIADSAVSTTPKSYGLVIVSHIPFSMKKKRYADLWKLRKFINDINSHTTGIIGNVKYDFTKLDDVKILMCIAGHIHEDSDKYLDGVLHLTTANDGKWQDVTIKNSKVSRRKSKTVNEQCFDCLCISNDHKIVHAYRIGYGTDRHYHLDPVNLTINKTKKMKTMLKGPVKWINLSVKGKNSNIESEPDEILFIDKSGIVRGIKKGSAKVVARDQNGNREFFNVVVQ